MENLKLYVWEGVLCSWINGTMFALAENADEARKLIAKKMAYEVDDLRIEPREVIEKEGFFVYGSD